MRQSPRDHGDGRDPGRPPRGILAAFEEIEDWPALTAVLQQEHRAILAAIESGDAERAAELTETHIRGAYRRLPGLHSGTIV